MNIQEDDLIVLNEFCVNHGIDLSFINSLQQAGLIEIIYAENKEFIEHNQINHLEKLVRFHYEFDINLEGIETVNHLLNQIEILQADNRMLKNRLRLYENE